MANISSSSSRSSAEHSPHRVWGIPASHTSCHRILTVGLRPDRRLRPELSCSSSGMAEAPQEAAAVDPLARFDQLPLHNKRVMITAPRQYAAKLTGLLVEAGAQPVWVPGVSISRLVDQQQLQQLDDALLDLSSYTHLAFTSKNGILAVLERLGTLTGGTPEAIAKYIAASGIKLCALGADGQVLQQAGLRVDVSPAEASTRGLAAELAATGQAQGARVLCPVPHVTGGLVEPPVVPRFLEALQAAGAAAVRVPAYLTALGLPGPECCGPEAQLLHNGLIDAVAFSSTAEAQGLCQLMGGKELLVSSMQQHRPVLAAHGPYTAAGAADVLGLPVPVVSKDFSTFHGLVRALAEALQQSKRD